MNFWYGFVLGFSIAGCMMWWVDKLCHYGEVG